MYAGIAKYSSCEFLWCGTLLNALLGKGLRQSRRVWGTSPEVGAASESSPRRDAVHNCLCHVSSISVRLVK